MRWLSSLSAPREVVPKSSIVKQPSGSNDSFLRCKHSSVHERGHQTHQSHCTRIQEEARRQNHGLILPDPTIVVKDSPSQNLRHAVFLTVTYRNLENCTLQSSQNGTAQFGVKPQIKWSNFGTRWEPNAQACGVTYTLHVNCPAKLTFRAKSYSMLQPQKHM